MPQAFSGSDKLGRQVLQVGAADIAQLNPLEGIPNALVGVEIRGIAWKLLQMQALGRSSLEKVFDLVPSMDR